MFTTLPLRLNNVPVKLVQSHKHLGLTLDSLNFHEDIYSILSKVKIFPAVLLKLQTVLPRDSLLKADYRVD